MTMQSAICRLVSPVAFHCVPLRQISANGVRHGNGKNVANVARLSHYLSHRHLSALRATYATCSYRTCRMSHCADAPDYSGDAVGLETLLIDQSTDPSTGLRVLPRRHPSGGRRAPINGPLQKSKKGCRYACR